jgi:PAS domain S-box-containing protein
MTGYTAQEVKGKTSVELDIWADPADRVRLVEGLREHGEVANLEASFRAKDGRVKVCLMSARIMQIGGETCILSITRDISQIKQAQKRPAGMPRNDRPV